MHDVSFLIIAIVIFALGFDFINGFHDTANAIATVVATRVLTPGAAIVMAAVLNFVGAVCFTKVAETFSSGLVTNATQTMVLAALIGAIVWNLITWYFGIPSSSSHALVGGVVGAAVMNAGFASIVWNSTSSKMDHGKLVVKQIGLLPKVLIPLLTSPLMGFALGFAIMSVLYLLFARSNPRRVGGIFRHLQVVSAAGMAFAHGTNDAQKSMGIITLALFANVPGTHAVPTWVKLACATAMAFGTASGGWRIIGTMGHKIIRLEPVNGFAAETAASLVILYSTLTGATVSTTHVISGSIFGVGAARRLKAVNWSVAQRMLIAWVLTIPASALVAGLAFVVLKALGVK